MVAKGGGGVREGTPSGCVMKHGSDKQGAERDACWKELSSVVNTGSPSKLQEESWKSVRRRSHFQKGEHGLCVGTLPVS